MRYADEEGCCPECGGTFVDCECDDVHAPAPDDERAEVEAEEREVSRG